MPPVSTAPNGMEDTSYPSRNIAFRAAAAITSIVDNLAEHDQLRYCPAFIVYSLFSALIMHVYQNRSTNPTVVADSKERLRKCMKALKEISKVWIVAKMVYTLFESILGNKALEERLQKSAGRRHHSRKHQQNRSNRESSTSTEVRSTTEPIKRKFDEMDIGGHGHSGRPVPNMSYERSRPQTPAPTPGGIQGNTAGMSAPGSTTPHLRQGTDIFMGGQSQGGTRPPTPFQQPNMSIPATPPDLYLVTRSSPPIPQSLWENFQPGQLFPDDSGISYLSPPNHNSNSALDPQLASPSMPLSQNSMNQSMQNQMQSTSPISMSSMQNTGMSQQHAWPASFEIDPNGAMGPGSSPEDTWSNSSGEKIVPTALNVEDWYDYPPPSVLVLGTLIPDARQVQLLWTNR